MSGWQGFAVSAWGWRVALLSDCAAMRRALDRYVLPWLPRTPPEGLSADAVFEIARQDGGYVLRACGQAVNSSRFVEEMISMLQSWLDDAIVRRIENRAPLHAGAAALDGAAVLLPGSTHAGKSTLVRELLRIGFAYYSDEYALIDREGCLHPYPRALMLRNGRGESRPALPSEWNAEVGRAPARVALIATLAWAAPGGTWQVERRPQSEMLLALLRNTPRELGGPCAMLGPLAAAVAGAECYAGSRGEAAEAAGRIARLLTDLR